MSTKKIQSDLILATERFRTYGNYRTREPRRWDTDRFEHYFFERFFRERPETKSLLIPVDWWNIHGFEKRIQDRITADLTDYFRSLDPGRSYFMVATTRHLGSVPRGTRLYSGGGVYEWDRPISVFGCYDYKPIPLLGPAFQACPSEERDLFAVFSGFYHPHDVRRLMMKRLHGLPKYKVSPRIPFKPYREDLGRARFALCPAGTGPTSFRLYEAMLSGAVPVYISEEFYLPYKDKYDWKDLCVFVTPQEIDRLPELLESIPDARVEEMRRAIASFCGELLFEAVYERIIEDQTS